MNNDNNEREYHASNLVGVLAGLLVGTLAGAATMFLLAPQSGKRTRMQIQQKSIELRDQTTEMIEDAVAQVRSEGKKLNKEGRQQAKKLLMQGQSALAEQMEHVSDAVKSGKKNPSERTFTFLNR